LTEKLEIKIIAYFAVIQYFQTQTSFKH